MLSQLPKRIFIDATYTVGSGKSSGIERVVRNLLRECDALDPSLHIPKPKLVVSHAGKFFEAGEADLQAFRKTAAMQANAIAAAPTLYRHSAQILCKTTRSAKLRKWLLPQPGHLGMFKLLHTFREWSIFRSINRTRTPIVPRDDDLFILPDAYWINRLRNSVWPAAAQARKNGAIVASVIYDLIPLTHPEFVGVKRRDAFDDYLRKAACHSDLLIAISDTVRDQVAEYLASIDEPEPKFCNRIKSFQLGAELRSATGSIRSKVSDQFSDTKSPYLMVATFDPRKNHTYLLDAFELLWNSQPDLSLCLVGRIGSRCDEVVSRILQHPRFGKQLHLFDDLSDAELQHCYRHARGVIFPSIVEGFGLPIVESLWFGKKTFVSDTLIHREVGRDDCCYFSLDYPSSLAASILSWESAVTSGKPLSLPTRKPTSWQESCEQVLSHCFSVFDERSDTSMPEKKAA